MLVAAHANATNVKCRWLVGLAARWLLPFAWCAVRCTMCTAAPPHVGPHRDCPLGLHAAPGQPGGRAARLPGTPMLLFRQWAACLLAAAGALVAAAAAAVMTPAATAQEQEVPSWLARPWRHSQQVIRSPSFLVPATRPGMDDTAPFTLPPHCVAAVWAPTQS